MNDLIIWLNNGQRTSDNDQKGDEFKLSLKAWVEKLLRPNFSPEKEVIQNLEINTEKPLKYIWTNDFISSLRVPNN